MKKLNEPISEKKKVFIFALIFLIMTLADLICTYLGTPNLEREGNPLISVFGLGWKALITANIIGYIIYVILICIILVPYKRIVVKCEGLKQYISMIHYERPDKFIWYWCKFPKKSRMIYLIAPIGYALAIAPIVARLVVVFEWILYLSGSNLYFWYWRIAENITFRYKSIYIGPFVLVSLITVFFIYFYWIYKEYKINKKALEDLETKSNYS